MRVLPSYFSTSEEGLPSKHVLLRSMYSPRGKISHWSRRFVKFDSFKYLRERCQNDDCIIAIYIPSDEIHQQAGFAKATTN